jgi:DNA-binding transcriptional ArsR family regulator
MSGQASVTELAEPLAMSMRAVTKHLKVLENAGLIRRSRAAQWRPCRIQGAALGEAADWIQQYCDAWEKKLIRLEDYLKERKARGERKWPRPTVAPPQAKRVRSSS